MRICEIFESEELVPKMDLVDAFEVLRDYLFYYKISIEGEKLKQAFNEAWENAELETININELKPHHDWGRRPESQTPIIVAHFLTGEYVILDGQHRLIVAREQNKKTIEAFVLEFPFSATYRKRKR
jgi:hypothetical protein